MCNTCYEFARRHNLFEVDKTCTINVLNSTQVDHIIGSMLGDGSIECGKLAKHARLCIARQSKDQDYVKWQAEIFSDICGNDPVNHLAFFDKRTGKTYLRTYFRTRNCPAITDYHIKWYPNGQKIVPRDLVLTPLILLIWFLDDGSCNVDKGKNSDTLRIDLNTMGFSEVDNIFLSQILSTYLNDTVKVLKSRKHFYLRLNNSAARKFISFIDSIFPQCMLRKAKWKNSDFYNRKII